MSAATFEALGTYVFLTTRRPTVLPQLNRLAAEILNDVDRACSRFREDSDLALANRHAGSWVEVDPLLVAAVGTACDAARQTDGLVNPLLGRPLEQLGYDRDFGLLSEREDLPLGDVAAIDPAAWQRIELDQQGAIRVPAGTALDLGSTGKAWTADLIAAACTGEFGAAAIISLGGDIAIAEGDGTDEALPWPIEISTHPGEPGEITITLDRGGLATSSTQVRRWARRGVRLHHLLDPRTGLPAPSTWRTVTATGPSATAANIASTAAIVLGDEAPAWLEDRGVAARLVAAEGGVRTTGSWPAADEERRGT